MNKDKLTIGLFGFGVDFFIYGLTKNKMSITTQLFHVPNSRVHVLFFKWVGKEFILNAVIFS